MAIVAAFAISSALIATTHFASIYPEAKKMRYGIVSIHMIRDYARMRAEEGKFLRSLIDKGLLPDKKFKKRFGELLKAKFTEDMIHIQPAS